MKELSIWAQRNPKKSILIITISHLLVAINALCFGILLYFFDWGESPPLLFVAANLFFIAFVFYPSKNKKTNTYNSSYLRRKAHDFCLVIFSSIVITLGVNNFLAHDSHIYNQSPMPTAQFMVHKNNSEIGTKGRSKTKVKFKDLRKKIKQEFRELKNELRDQTGKGSSALTVILKIFLILLTLVLAVMLAHIIAQLACNLSCSGYPELATAVMLLGIVGIIWAGVIAIKTILQRVKINKSLSEEI